MTEFKLTYSKLVQISRGLVQGILDDMWDGQEIYSDKGLQARLYIAGELFDLESPYDILTTNRYRIRDPYDTDVKKCIEKLYTFGFLKPSHNGELTPKALDLLGSDSRTDIFISYRRAESSLLALYLQSRLKLAGSEAFVDVNNLNLGDDWHPQLQNKVQSSTYFICLIAPTTLQSEYVRKEIQWAQATGVKMIPVFHNGFDANAEPNKSLIGASDYLAKITQKHGHVIKDSDDPNAYRNAADEILTSLGYAVL